MKTQTLGLEPNLLEAHGSAILAADAPCVLITTTGTQKRGGTSGVIKRLIGAGLIPPLEGEMLYVIALISEENGCPVISRSAITERMRINRSVIYNRLRTIVEAELAEVRTIDATTRRGPKPRVYIVDPRAIESRWRQTLDGDDRQDVESKEPLAIDPEVSETGEPGASQLGAGVADLLSGEIDPNNRPSRLPEDAPVKGEQLGIFALPTLLPSGRSQTRDPINAQVRYHNQYLEVTVRSTAGVPIAKVRDSRVLAAIITLCSDRIHRQGLPPENPWLFSIEEIAEIIERNTPRENRGPGSSSGSYKGWILDVLKRWQATQFEIQHVTPKMRDYYGQLVHIEESFRFINRMKVLSWVGRKGRTPGDICLYLDELLIDRIRAERFAYTLTLQPSLMAERNDFAYRISLWCRRCIQRHREPSIYTIDYIHNQADPTSSLANFKEALSRLREARIGDDGVVRLHGYCLIIDRDRGEITFWADPNDELIGGIGVPGGLTLT